MSTLNVGIVAHVDAGKTSLTERLLYAAGVIDELGSVDDGSTQTDSLALERQRGITIRSAVVSFVLPRPDSTDRTVNLIDTPGHPDFIAEVERVLGVLDGAVLVVSAVEGVQAQTRILMRTLQRLRIPTLIFVNKIDRSGAAPEAVVRAIAERLTPEVVAMQGVVQPGTRSADVTPYGGGDPAFTDRLVDLLAGNDDALLASFVDDARSLTYARLRKALAAQTARSLVHPVFFGSAITGAGVDALIDGVAELLPAAPEDPHGPVSGTVFKVERGRAGEKVAYVRMYSGRLRTRQRLRVGTGEARVTAINVFDGGTPEPAAAVTAGQIGQVRGLSTVRIGDPIGQPQCSTKDGSHGGSKGVSQNGSRDGSGLAPPTLETVVEARRPGDRGALLAALTELAEQDPLINLRLDDVRHEVWVSLYGEVQKEVIAATLADEYGVAVTFRPTTTVCIERLVGSGSAYEIIEKGDNPFLATVGLRLEPAPAGHGLDYRLGVELGSMPYAFMKAVEETVAATLREGLQGWSIPDCRVTLTHSGYYPRQSHMGAPFDKSMSSTAGDFRLLTPLVLMDALLRARTVVHEPLHRFRLEIPTDAYGSVLPVLVRLRGVPRQPEVHRSVCVVDGDIPAAKVHDLRQRLPGLTRGEAVLETTFDRYAPVAGAPPSRPRTDHNPLNRKEYLLHVQRLVPRSP